ncbi:hypothetical protein IFR04_005835 [Cadophora malorum]|uniref:Uncharacterized protein n=1 Tax=Cadophora malorum TaxID=108018 RepID=A0A8H7TK79_9HELO|nr:hypothetical protein IFR04_005835 [Cadophora malorum]
MTNRNLNGNWIDTLSRQYTYDLLDNSPHPIIYHLYNPQKQKDLYYLIPTKIEEPQLRRSLVQYHQQTKNTDTLTWENELSAFLVSVASLPLVAQAWDFEIFDGDCVTSTDLVTGTTDMECETTANPHECFRISNMGTCELYLHSSVDSCEAGDSEQFYDAGNEDVDISPMFSWDSWSMLC